MWCGWNVFGHWSTALRRRMAYLLVAVVVLPLTILLLERAFYWYHCDRVAASASEQLRAERARRRADVDGKVDGVGQPPFDLPILIPAATRPNYLRQVLAGLAACHHIEQATVVFSQDGDLPEVTDLIQRWNASRHIVHMRHIHPYGGIPTLVTGYNEYLTSANVRFLLSFAFDYMRAPGAIMLESDLVPSVDMFDYFQWSFGYFLNDNKYFDRVLNINGFNMESSKDRNPYGFFPSSFVVWGWCMSRKYWPQMDAEWTRYEGWDWAVQRMRIRHNLISISPEVSRILNIGMQGINFHLTSAEEAEWASVYLQQTVPDYVNHLPTVRNSADDVN